MTRLTCLDLFTPCLQSFISLATLPRMRSCLRFRYTSSPCSLRYQLLSFLTELAIAPISSYIRSCSLPSATSDCWLCRTRNYLEQHTECSSSWLQDSIQPFAAFSHGMVSQREVVICPNPQLTPLQRIIWQAHGSVLLAWGCRSALETSAVRSAQTSIWPSKSHTIG